MADEKKKFKRKLSAEEVAGNYIVVQKKELDFFPKIGKSFKLKIGEKNEEIYIEATECWCQGPKKPHSHYRINTSGFKQRVKWQWGKKVVIENVGKGQYLLTN